MLKDLKEKVKNISEIVGMISVVGTLIVVITAALYNFGFFSYFSISVWKLPITISEIITDVVVILPKLLLVLVVCVIAFFISNIMLFLITESFNFIINIVYAPNKKKDDIRAKSIIAKYVRKYGVPIFTIASLMYFLSIFVFVIYKNKPVDYNPFILFSVWLVTFICFNLIGRMRITIFWIIFSLLIYFMTMISSGIYDANIEANKKYVDSIVKIDGSVIDDIKILKVYDSGIIVISSPSKLKFFYSSDIKDYCLKTEKNNIFRDDILVDTNNEKNRLLYRWIKVLYRYVKVFVSYNSKMAFNCVFDYSTCYITDTYISCETLKKGKCVTIKTITNDIVNFFIIKKEEIGNTI